MSATDENQCVVQKVGRPEASWFDCPAFVKEAARKTPWLFKGLFFCHVDSQQALSQVTGWP